MSKYSMFLKKNLNKRKDFIQNKDAIKTITLEKSFD